MPFKSEVQRKLCYVKALQDVVYGKTPRWNCFEFENKKTSPLKRRKESPLKRRLSPKKKASPRYIPKKKNKSPVKRTSRSRK